jgi:hypothetical protein
VSWCRGLSDWLENVFFVLLTAVEKGKEKQVKEYTKNQTESQMTDSPAKQMQTHACGSHQHRTKIN